MSKRNQQGTEAQEEQNVSNEDNKPLLPNKVIGEAYQIVSSLPVEFLPTQSTLLVVSDLEYSNLEVSSLVSNWYNRTLIGYRAYFRKSWVI